jgi:DNA-directed RNA polymerase I subunit RPA49
VTPGLTLSQATDFHPYDKVDAPTAKKRKKNAPPSEMLLHSTSHRSLDYTAQEDRPKDSRPLVRHFIGVFDPKTGKVEVVESKKMVVRGTVRSQKASDDAMRAKKVCIFRVLFWMCD